MVDKGLTSSEALAFFSPFFGGVAVLAGKVLGVKVYASPFLGGWAHPALPE